MVYSFQTGTSVFDEQPPITILPHRHLVHTRTPRGTLFFPYLRVHPLFQHDVVVARYSLPGNKMWDYFPAASLMSFQHVQFNFGNAEYRYPPPVQFRSLNGVADAGGT